MKPFVDPHLLQRLRVGPLAAYFDAYLKQIEHDGFLPSSVPMQMYAIARFSKWLRDRQLDLAHVDEATVERFLQRDSNIVHSSESASLRRLLALLRGIGITMARVPEPKNCLQQFTDDYRRYLLQERGLAEVTSIIYVGFAEQFLANRFGRVRPLRVVLHPPLFDHHLCLLQRVENFSVLRLPTLGHLRKKNA